MNKTCFVIMGFGIKKNLNLDLTYNCIIKPCIIENSLIPFPLFEDNAYNAYRCDEISGNTSIDFNFVTCLKGADIVIADISTMNINAIYELGARHALRPRSTILICSKNKKSQFKFFDLTYVPIVFYEHGGMFISEEEILKVKQELNARIAFAMNSTDPIPDNPIQRAIQESTLYIKKKNPPINLYQIYLTARRKLDDNNFEEALTELDELYKEDPTEENLALLVLAKYKLAEQRRSSKSLIDCLNFLKENFNTNESTSEELWGRMAAISLRIYNLSHNIEFYYDALEYYRHGAEYSSLNLYCPRNYCALLCRIYEITDDENIIKEYYYTAKHYSKIFISRKMSVIRQGTYEERIYYFYNRNDLLSISLGEYQKFCQCIQNIKSDKEISLRQRDTLISGISKLNADLIELSKIISS